MFSLVIALPIFALLILLEPVDRLLTVTRHVLLIIVKIIVLHTISFNLLNNKLGLAGLLIIKVVSIPPGQNTSMWKIITANIHHGLLQLPSVLVTLAKIRLLALLARPDQVPAT